jgi:hypothetical protein
MASSSFKFLNDDIERQRQMAREALEKAKALDEKIGQAPDGPEKIALIEARKTLLALAKGLADNANLTSTTATTVIGSVSAVRSST